MLLKNVERIYTGTYTRQGDKDHTSYNPILNIYLLHLSQTPPLEMPPVRKSSQSPTKRSPKKVQKPEPLELEIVPPPVLYQSDITNSLYHRIVIKTLEHALSKNMDWHKMSQEILADDEASGIVVDKSTKSPKKGRGKGKGKGKGKEKATEAEAEDIEPEEKKGKELTGTESRELRGRYR
jgi:hypothetical protein